MSAPPSTDPRTVVLFGGTFDPPHRAHVAQAMVAAQRLGAEEVVFIPNASNPQKTDTAPTPSHHRLAMLELALEGHPRASISRVELDHPGPSYTVDTLRRLVREPSLAGARLRLLIGADQALNFTTWKDWEAIEQMAEPVVMPRPPHTHDRLLAEYEVSYPETSDQWARRTLDMPVLEGCSTDLRPMIAAGRSLAGLLDPAVEGYVRRHRLYGWSDPTATIEAS